MDLMRLYGIDDTTLQMLKQIARRDLDVFRGREDQLAAAARVAASITETNYHLAKEWPRFREAYLRMAESFETVSLQLSPQLPKVMSELQSSIIASSKLGGTVVEALQQAHFAAWKQDSARISGILEELTHHQQLPWQTPVVAGFVDLVGSYTSLAESVETPVPRPAPTVLVRPAHDVFLHGRLVKSVVNGGEVEEDAVESPETELQRHLRRHPALLLPWRGMRAALRSPDNPDRMRHVCASARELLDSTLDTLAPTPAVRAWTQDAEHYRGGSLLKRTTRVRFIARHAPQTRLAEFLVEDLQSLSPLFKVLDGGVHGRRPTPSSQAFVVVARVEALMLGWFDVESGDGKH